jgi:hypothetical protein
VAKTTCDTATKETVAALRHSATGNSSRLPVAAPNPGTVQPSSALPQRARARTAGDPSATPTGKIRRARKGEWEEAYFDALTRGHAKASAAGIAGVSERCVYKRAKEDSDFAEREWIAYHLGTAALMKIALDRVRDPVHPDSNILIHLLAMRGIDRKRVIEHRPPESGSAETQNMIPIDRLSIETRRRIVAELEAIERCSANVKDHPPANVEPRPRV